jgi:DNA-binding transcriptional LysR family regulator
MDKAMDRLGSISTFVRAAETRSFTAAARELGISASAVGKTILRLEQRLGVRLFHRSTRSIALTPEGALFLARCQRIIEEVDAAEDELAQSTAAPTGRLRVGLPMNTALLMPVLVAFMQQHPGIELDLDFNDRLVDVIDEGFDIVLRTGDASDSRLVTRELGLFTHAIVAAPAYLARHGTPTAPEDLLDHACLQHRFPSTGKLEPWPLSRDGVDLALDLPRTAVVSNTEPLVTLAEAGLGFCCVPRYTIRAALLDGTLVSVLEPYLHLRRVFRALWPSGRHASPKIRVFVDYLATHLFAGHAIDHPAAASLPRPPLKG